MIIKSGIIKRPKFKQLIIDAQGALLGLTTDGSQVFVKTSKGWVPLIFDDLAHSSLESFLVMHPEFKPKDQ